MQREKVLVADDSAAMRKSIAKALEAGGFEVIQAKNGLEAVELFRKHRPVLATLDIHMPEMDGIEALVQIMAVNPGARVVMVSSEARQQIQFQCQRKGAKYFFLKQEMRDMAILAEFIKNVVEGKPVSLVHKQVRRLPKDEAEAVDTAMTEILAKYDLDPRSRAGLIPDVSHYVIEHGFKGALHGTICYMTMLQAGLSIVKHIQEGVILEDIFNEVSGLISMNYESMGFQIDRISEHKYHSKPSKIVGRTYQFATPFGVIVVCNSLS
jgi:two-component system, chemotaxis family, chemotaxis protein CheY